MVWFSRTVVESLPAGSTSFGDWFSVASTVHLAQCTHALSRFVHSRRVLRLVGHLGRSELEQQDEYKNYNGLHLLKRMRCLQLKGYNFSGVFDCLRFKVKSLTCMVYFVMESVVTFHN
jgi:hypothetical protein